MIGVIVQELNLSRNVVLKLFRLLQGHKHLSEGGGVVPPIHFCTREAEWLTLRTALSIPIQRPTGTLRFRRSVVYFLSLPYYTNRQTRILILYSALLHVSAIYIGHRHGGIGSHKE